jgi:purine-binding chemotaxis protein CheW
MSAAPTPTTRQLVICSLGAEEYALPIGQVREIVRATEPRSVASDLPWMRGVISLRGMLVPVYDLALRLGVPGTDPPSPRAKIVIVETAGELAGVLVDDVVEVLTVENAQIEDVVPLGVEAGTRAASIAKLGERLVLLLDTIDLLASVPDATEAVPEGAPAVVA